MLLKLAWTPKRKQSIAFASHVGGAIHTTLATMAQLLVPFDLFVTYLFIFGIEENQIIIALDKDQNEPK